MRSTEKEAETLRVGLGLGSLDRARAHWIDVGVLAWDADVEICELIWSPEGVLDLSAGGVQGGVRVMLRECVDGAMDAEMIRRFPYLSGYTLWLLPAGILPGVPRILCSALAVQGRDADGELVVVSGVQTAGVIDAMYASAARTVPLGVDWRGGRPMLSLWAPTALEVVLLHYGNGTSQPPLRCAMSHDERTGVWNIDGEAEWRGDFYRYEVRVYMDSVHAIVCNEVTDPYSISLSTNSRFSQIVDVQDAALKPLGWDALRKIGSESPVDTAIYELHVRDFSIYDESVPAADRGRFRAFTYADSHGMRHLRRLAEAGITHVQLLPIFDFATVEEDAAHRTELDPAALALLPPDSEAQTNMVRTLITTDGYNWGYDPFHYCVPEGSYASDPEGPQRIREFRELVHALANCGLSVVVDVVFNHTYASGSSDKSVLDKIVPGYYHRRDADGAIEHSTCCENTAGEHAMMERLILDSVRLWATQYKVDGFRFDLMGHHLLSNMRAVRAMLDELTIARDGVDGKQLLLYGEGWDFGEMRGNARGRNASQHNLGGSGIGSFNDRLRDAVRGGTPFSDPRTVGFASGMFYHSGVQVESASMQRSQLETGDWLRLGLAGNLRNYAMETINGVRRGDEIMYAGEPAGYAEEPRESINYVSAHDNETLFDKIQWAAPDEADVMQRARMNLLALSFVVFAQGVPFFHAGDELLRSKSLDANSFNSSDWFNAIDWTLESNGWGRGLPPSIPQHWDEARHLLRDAALRPSREHAVFVRDSFCELLRIRRECSLFRMRSAADVNTMLHFCNCGPGQTPGLIVMGIDGSAMHDAGAYQRVLVAWNAAACERYVYVPMAMGSPFTLHPILRRSIDSIVQTAAFDAESGMLRMPGLTTAVFCL